MRLIYINIFIFLLIINKGSGALENDDSENELLDKDFATKTDKGAGKGSLELYHRARNFSKQLEPQLSAKCREMGLIGMKLFADINDANEDEFAKAQAEFQDFQGKVASDIKKMFPNLNDIPCSELRRELKLLSLVGATDFKKEDLEKLSGLIAAMSGNYNKIAVCEYKNSKNCELRKNDIQNIFKNSTDFEELAYYVTKFHDASNKVTVQQYKEYVDLKNKQAVASGFKNAAEQFIVEYDDDSGDFSASKFRKQFDDTWAELKPYYMKLHAFVRMQLRKIYGDKVADKEGHMPVHITADMWGSFWDDLDHITRPFPKAPTLDATEALRKKGYTVERMFHEADEFYQGIGLFAMTPSFWENTQMVRPPDKEVNCQPVASDLCVRTFEGKKGDYRIGLCGEVDTYHLETIYHEMGHVEYSMSFSHLHWVFRNAANPGFHEAIGDSLALSITTPNHLQCVLKLDMGLPIKCGGDNSTKSSAAKVTETDLNLLFYRSLSKIVLLAFAYSMENWRYDVFEGKIAPEDYNNKWWEIRKINQGLTPPSKRSATVFDPAAKFHIASDVGYTRYFVSYILQFQFYEAMCIAAKQYDPNNKDGQPLYQCDITGSKEAGQKMRKMLSVGQKLPWPDALEMLTGERKLTAKPMLNYFKPLFEHIENELKKAGEKSCFGKNCK